MNKVNHMFFENILAYTDTGALLRKRLITLINVTLICAFTGLSSFVLLLNENNPQNAVLLTALIFLKYIILLWVIYRLARNVAGQYFSHYYDVPDIEKSEKFLEVVVFGNGDEEIEVGDGFKLDDNSLLVKVGGPGKLVVGYDSAVLLEDSKGNSRVVHPIKNPSTIGRFERVLKISENEYAIIDLHKHLLKDISLTVRTRDGIPIETNKINITYSLLSLTSSMDQDSISSVFELNPEAVEALIYNQVVVIPRTVDKVSLRGLLDNAALSLVIAKLEQFINSYTLNELLEAPNQSDMDRLESLEKRISNLKAELGVSTSDTSQLAKMENERRKGLLSKVTTLFSEPSFKTQAANFGVKIEKVEISEWTFPSIIVERQNESRNLFYENEIRFARLDQLAKKLLAHEFVYIVQDLIVDIQNSPTERGVKSMLDKFRIEYMAVLEEATGGDDAAISNTDEVIQIKKVLKVIEGFTNVS